MAITDNGLTISNGNALITAAGRWLIRETGFVPPPPIIDLGNWRFLKDHYIAGDIYVFAGEIRHMFSPWVPTADVEPLDALSVAAFYAQGPSLGACIRTQFTSAFIYKPATYWYQSAPNTWQLSGLGAGLAPIPALIGRIEDKST